MEKWQSHIANGHGHRNGGNVAALIANNLPHSNSTRNSRILLESLFLDSAPEMLYPNTRGGIWESKIVTLLLSSYPSPGDPYHNQTWERLIHAHEISVLIHHLEDIVPLPSGFHYFCWEPVSFIIAAFKIFSLFLIFSSYTIIGPSLVFSLFILCGVLKWFLNLWLHVFHQVWKINILKYCF